jgi:ATP-dependent DNA helicase RecG
MAKNETQRTENKESWRDEFLRTVCAFANSKGGTMYVGRSDDGQVVGLMDTKKLMEDIPNKIINMLSVMPEVNLRKEKDKEYIEIKVKPYEVPISFKGKYYVRSGSTTHELNGASLQKFLLEKSNLTWDAVVEERASMKDIDTHTISHFKELATKRFPAAAEEKSIPGLLEKLHLLNKGKLTRAAILLFGKDPRKFYIGAYIKIGRFKYDNTLVAMDEIYGNLFQQAEGAIDTLKRKYLQMEIKIESLHRQENLEYPEVALREAIVNAIVHRDYTAIHTQLKIYPDHLSLWNNGELSQKLTLEKLKKTHSSYPRNELIADVFYKAAYIEAWGQGTIKMVDECKKAGLPEPLYEEDGGGMLVTFRKDIYTEENLLEVGLNDRQVKAVLYVKQKGHITNSEYCNVFKTTDRTASRDLKELVFKGIFKKEGDKKSSKYLLSR